MGMPVGPDPCGDLAWAGWAGLGPCQHSAHCPLLPQAPLCNGSMVWSVNLTANMVRTPGHWGAVAEAAALCSSFLSLAHTAGGSKQASRATLHPSSSGLPTTQTHLHQAPQPPLSCKLTERAA